MRAWRATNRTATTRQTCPVAGRAMLSRKIAHTLTRDLDDVRAIWCKPCCSYHVIPKGSR